jgi:ATP-dependent RNA helicase DDX41
MIDNKNNYLIRKEKDSDNKKSFKKDFDKEYLDEQEIYSLIKSSALLIGLENSKNLEPKEFTAIANWKFPKKFKQLTANQVKDIRKAYRIEIEGEDIPNPINSFKAMKFPIPILKGLEKKGIYYPTPIQMQGLPIILSGRDMIGIAFTGSGKSLVFILPAIMLAIEEEMKLPIVEGEGPFCFIIVPSRELAIQIHETINYFIKYFLRDINENHKHNLHYPIIKSCLCIGGIDIKYQIEEISKGCHIIVGTPGRLSDLLNKKRLEHSMCKLIVIDEAYRLLDMDFDEEIRKVLEKFTQPKQIAIFSSTMPRKIQEYASKCLYKPIVINFGRAGSTNLNVIQDIEYVKDESKLIQLMDTLQKTPPPVLIFCENKNDVDEIHEYLILKGIDTCSMHGDKDQEERNQAIREFREGLKDVLVATDIVSKGLDFPNIEHIINYDMPKEIENYVLRIGRTGRLGKVGRATTYINRNQDEAILLDLKHLLVEAAQKIPAFLLSIQEEDPSLASHECYFCGGLGHKLNQCHKLENQRMKMILNKTSKKL